MYTLDAYAFISVHKNMLDLQGYHGDTSATFFCGNVDEKAKKLVQVCVAYSSSVLCSVLVS